MTHRYALQLSTLSPAHKTGFVTKVSPGRVEASGPLSTIGDICEIGAENVVLAEVVAVEPTHIVLAPLDQTASIMPDTLVTARPVASEAPVGDLFAGRAVDAMAAPIDGQGPILPDAHASLSGQVLAPLDRVEPDAPLETGVRAIDGLLTIGRGQRIGVFSASGVGKTTLITQLATQIVCDHVILCLVGERGREVESIWSAISRQNDIRRFTCVTATSDQSAPQRVRAVYQALALGEHWRAEGKHVLLIIDSVTRLAMALREIGLAAGAPPTLRAYTPNVFAALPRVVERCGAAKGQGAITAIMTVLSETDDVDDPIVEIMKALLDGHIILARPLAEQNHFPSIDVLRSISRQSERLMRASHAGAAKQALKALSTYDDARIMVESGIYKQGANARLDEAIGLREGLLDFLRQPPHDRTPLSETLTWLQSATARAVAHA
jgi:flagellum-specific ATP synthase